MAESTGHLLVKCLRGHIHINPVIIIKLIPTRPVKRPERDTSLPLPKPNSALRLPNFSWPMTNPTPEDGKHAIQCSFATYFPFGCVFVGRCMPLIRQREHGLHPSSWYDTWDIAEALPIRGTSCTPSARMAQGPQDACFHDKWGNGPSCLVGEWPAL